MNSKIWLVILFLVCFIGSFFGGAAWKDAQWRNTPRDTTITKLQKEITFLKAEISKRDADISYLTGSLGADSTKLEEARKTLIFFQRLVDSLRSAIDNWNSHPTGPPPTFPVANLNLPMSTKALINNAEVDVNLTMGTRFHFSDLSFRDNFVHINPIQYKQNDTTITIIDNKVPVTNIFNGVWLSFNGFKEYRSKFASSELSIFSLRISAEWNVMTDCVLTTDPFFVNWSTRLPEYGISLGCRKKLF